VFSRQKGAGLAPVPPVRQARTRESAEKIRAKLTRDEGRPALAAPVVDSDGSVIVTDGTLLAVFPGGVAERTEADTQEAQVGVAALVRHLLSRAGEMAHQHTIHLPSLAEAARVCAEHSAVPSLVAHSGRVWVVPYRAPASTKGSDAAIWRPGETPTPPAGAVAVGLCQGAPDAVLGVLMPDLAQRFSRAAALVGKTATAAPWSFTFDAGSNALYATGPDASRWVAMGANYTQQAIEDGAPLSNPGVFR
jgi:hypothetical protein